MNGVAFCPAHITGFFKAELDPKFSPEKMGSMGAGFSIKDGVITKVSVRKFSGQDKNNFLIKNKGYRPDNTQVSQFVINEFLKLVKKNEYFVEVEHYIEVPVGYGLGCSAAAALSLSYALDQALNTKLSKEQIGKIAHKAEIFCKTGLGDVLASFHGGFEIRTKPGAPGIGMVEKMDPNSPIVIMICFSPISTRQFMKEKMHLVNGLGGKMVNKLLRSKDCNSFQDMSVEFANYVKVITPKMNSVIQELNKNGIRCGVALFGETVFTLVSKQDESKVITILKKSDGIIFKSTIDNLGARLTQ